MRLPELMAALSLALLGAVFTCTRADEMRFRRHVVSADSTYSACAAMDVNRDGRLDIVCGGWWYEAPAWKRHFLREVEIIRGRYDGYSHLPLDVDGDGWMDFITANYRSSKLAWIQNPGARPGPWTEHLIARPGPMETGRLADVDGDGRLDILPNGVRFAAWWELEPGGADAPRWRRHDLPAEVAGHGVGFGDIDGDGRGDIVGPAGWLRAPQDRRRGEWTWHAEFELDRRASIPILVFDVDGDGDSDLVWGRGHDFGLYWLEQVRGAATGGGERGGPRTWLRHAIDTSWSQPHALLVADLDGLGAPEVIAGKRYMAHDGKDPGAYDPLVICRYRYDSERRTWRRGVVSSGFEVGFGLDPKAADLDGDGDLDLVVCGRSGLYILENLARSPASPAPPAPPAGAAAHPAPPPGYADHSKLLVYKDAAGGEHAVETPFEWGRRRADIVRNMELVMGELPDPARRVPLDVRVTEVVETPRYVRRKLSYASEPGDRVPAYLLIPRDLRGKAPAMLCLHQTVRIGKDEPAGLGERMTLRYAHELAERGYVAIVPDYPSFGEYDYDFQAGHFKAAGYQSGSMKAMWNNIRAVDLLETLPEVDVERIGCIGHSLGGHNAMFTAVFDQRLTAVVSSCGFTAFHDYYEGRLEGWTSDRYMPRIRSVYGSDPDRMPFDFHEVVAALAPRPFFANAPQRDSNFEVAGVRKVIGAAAGVYALLGAAEKLRVVSPDGAHDFSDGAREEAYRALDEWLGRQPRTRGAPGTRRPSPRRVGDLLSAAERRQLGEELAELDRALERDAANIALYSRRGDLRFFRGEFREAVADYEKMVELDPALAASHWRRGIAYFYAGRYEDAARQFETYHTHDDVDRENGIWRYLSQARAYGLEKAREGLLRYEKDDREPFPDVYRMFAGTMSGAEVLEKIKAARVSPEDREQRLFYADLYVGLNHSIENRDVEALSALRRAVENTWVRRAGFGPRYMWHVGRVHYNRLRAKEGR